MKTKLFLILFISISLFIIGCGYDNFDEPKSILTGRVVYEGKAVGVRTNGSQLELWQDGYALKTVIPVHIKHDGTFSASLFNGQYKLVRKGDSPWLPQFSDTIIVNVNGPTSLDVPITPYFTVSNESFHRTENMITARFKVNKVVESAKLDFVRFYFGKSILTDQVQAEHRVDANIDDIKLDQETTILTEVPDNLKNLDYIFVRIGVKSTSSGEYYYTQVQKLALK